MCKSRKFNLSRNNFRFRYYELENIHGQLGKLLDVDLSPKEQAEVKLVFEDENRVECRRICLNQTVAGFKKSLQTFCGLPPTKFYFLLLKVIQYCARNYCFSLL